MARFSIDKARIRNALEIRREPYWGAPLSKGLFLGYRKTETGGSWIARKHSDGRHRYNSVGQDDISYDDAVLLARTWAKEIEAGIDTSAVVTVADACREYVKDRAREKGEANARDAEYRYARTIYKNAIGKRKLTQLRSRDIKDWRASMDMAPASRNRNLATLKAALNFAVHERYVSAGQAIEWSTIKPEPVTARRELVLDRQQRAALVDALPDFAQAFVRVLCLLPLRPGALASTTVHDFKPRLRMLRINHDKANAGRDVPLSAETVALLQEQARDKLPAAPLIHYTDGTPWNKERWKTLIARAAKKAGLPAETVAYTLRHSVITDMLRGGIDPMTVGKIAGTSLLMIEKHYGHLLHAETAAAMDKLAL